MTCVCKKDLPEGARRLTIDKLSVDWGDEDLRGEWAGGYVFCSFGCMADWAKAKAAEHDGRTLVEGKA